MSNHAVILAGGTGKRMGEVKLPKQFLEICNEPIIILTLNQIIKSKLFDSIVIVVHEDWIDYMKELLLNSSIQIQNINLINGGNERIDSIENAIDYLKNNKIKNDDVVVFCDAVRPFITTDILTNAVNETKKYGATVAICPVKDTMIISENNLAIDIPKRSNLYHGQAPDSFKFNVIYDSIKSLTPKEKRIVTGTAQICQIKGVPVHTIMGDEKNIKITTMIDLFVGTAIYKEIIKNESLCLK